MSLICDCAHTGRPKGLKSAVVQYYAQVVDFGKNVTGNSVKSGPRILLYEAEIEELSAIYRDIGKPNNIGVLNISNTE